MVLLDILLSKEISVLCELFAITATPKKTSYSLSVGICSFSDTSICMDGCWKSVQALDARTSLCVWYTVMCK